MTDLDFDTALQLLDQHSTNPDAVSKAIYFLADSSAKSPTSRENLASLSAIESLLTLLDASLANPNTPAATTIPTLRCIGNATIDSDAARQIITNHGFGWVPLCFFSDPSNTEIRTRAFLALYNTCHDFEPAQQRCHEEHVHEDLLSLFSDFYDGSEVTSIEWCEQFGELLLSMCEKRQADDELRDEASRELMLDCALLLRGRQHEGGAEDLATAVELALVYLRDKGEQGKFIQQGLIGKVWRMLVDLEDYLIDPETIDEDDEVKKLLPPLSTSLTWVLSDIAAHPKFAEHYANRSDFVHNDIFEVIKTSDPRLVSAACQVFGNLFWALKDKNHSTYSINVMDEDLHRGLMNCVTRLEKAETLYSVAGLLVQLCRHSAEYRTRFCNDERLEAVLRTLCESESKEVRQGGMKLLRLLGKDDSAIRERYAGLARQVLESLVAEQNASQQNAIQQNGGSVVEIPD